MADVETIDVIVQDVAIETVTVVTETIDVKELEVCVTGGGGDGLSPENTESLYINSDTNGLVLGASNDAKIHYDGTDLIVDAGSALKVLSADSSNYVSISHDNSSAWFETDDGWLIFRTNETGAKTVLAIMGDSNYGELRAYDQDNSEFAQIYCSNGYMMVTPAGDAPAGLRLLHDAHGDIECFSSSQDNETKELKIYGWKSGAPAREVLEIGVGVDAADTASFDGVGTYQFDGEVKVLSADGSNYVSIEHNNLNTWFKSDDGGFYFRSLEDGGTNAHLRIYDADEQEYLTLAASPGGQGAISTGGTSPASLQIQYNAHADVILFAGATDSETPELKIYGYTAGDSGQSSLEIGISATAADTASFDGVGTYQFDGTVKVLSADSSNYVSITHDNTDVYFKTDDGGFHFQSDASENSPIRIYNDDGLDYLSLSMTSTNVGLIATGGDSPGNLFLQYSAHADIELFKGATSGDTRELKIYGYVSGDSQKRVLEIGVGVDAANTASFDGVGTYQFDGVLKVLSADSSNYVSISHDNSYAWIKTDDGLFKFKSDEANTNAHIQILDQDGSEYLQMYCTEGYSFIASEGTSPNSLYLNYAAKSDVQLFSGSTVGDTKEFRIYGYKSGDSQLRNLSIGVGVDAADTASFDGVGNYWFDGRMSVGTLDTLGSAELYIRSANASGTAAADTWTDDIVIDSSGSGGIAILSSDAGASFITFGSPSNNRGADIGYYHDTNNLYISNRLASGTLSLKAGGDVEALHIDASRNVGIGTTNPDGKLHVHSGSAGTVTANSAANELVIESAGSAGINLLAPDSQSSYILFGNESSNYNAEVSWIDTSNYLRVGTNKTNANLIFVTGTSTEAMRIDASQNVGIGLTPTANMDGLSVEAGLLTLKETTEPTADSGYGKLYTKTDNRLYFQDGAGSEHEVTIAAPVKLKSPSGAEIPYGGGASTDVARGTALIAAIAAASASDTIMLGPGTFDVGTSKMTIPDDVSLIGCGQRITIIESACVRTTHGMAMTPGNNCYLTGFTLDAAPGDATVIPFGAFRDGTVTDVSGTGVVVESVRIVGTPDCVMGLTLTDATDGLDIEYTFIDCDFLSAYDCVATATVDGAPTVVMEFYNCRMESDVSLPGGTATARCLSISENEGSVEMRLFGCTLQASGGSSVNVGVRTSGGDAELNNTRIRTSGTGAFDIKHTSGTLSVCGGHGSDTGGAYTTSGTISNLVGIP